MPAYTQLNPKKPHFMCLIGDADALMKLRECIDVAVRDGECKVLDPENVGFTAILRQTTEDVRTSLAQAVKPSRKRELLNLAGCMLMGCVGVTVGTIVVELIYWITTGR